MKAGHSIKKNQFRQEILVFSMAHFIEQTLEFYKSSFYKIGPGAYHLFLPQQNKIFGNGN